MEPDPDPDPNPEVTTGKIEISIVTTGLGPDPRGYTVTIESENAVEAGTNETITSEDIEEGNYSVELTDIEDHCTIESENPVSVDVVAEETAQVEFKVTCKGIFREKIVFFRATSQSSKSKNSMANESYFTMNYDGSDVEKAADLNKDGRTHYLSDISPDGNKIAVVGSQTEPYYYQEIYVLNTDGSNITKVTGKQGKSVYYSDLKWSPDGSRLLFASNQDGTPEDEFSYAYVPMDGFLVNTDGSNLVNLTNTANINESNFMWSQ